MIPATESRALPRPPGTVDIPALSEWRSYGVIVPGQGRGAVAVVSDRRLTTAALATLLAPGVDRGPTDTAEGLFEIQQMIKRHDSQVVVMDVNWPWPAAVARLAEGMPLILLLDPEDEAAAFSAAHLLGPHGYLSRTASQQALRLAITALRTVGTYLDPVLAGRVMWSERNPLNGFNSGAALSAREREILVEIANGRSSKEIARDYAVTPKTICNHVSNIYTKLHLRHRGQLVLYAAREGLAQPVLPPIPVESP